MKYYMTRIRENVPHYVKKDVVAFGWSAVNFSAQITSFDDVWSEVHKKCYSSGIKPATVTRKKNEIKRLLSIQTGDILLIPVAKGFIMAEATSEWFFSEEDKEVDLANQLKVKYKKDSNGDPIIYQRKGNNTGLVTRLGVRGFTILEYTNEEAINAINALWLQSKDDTLTLTSRLKLKENEQIIALKQELVEVLQNYYTTSLAPGGRGFEELVAALFQIDGYATHLLSKKCGKGKADADVLAVKESALDNSFNTAFFIQAKHHSGESNSHGLDQLIAFKENVELNTPYEFIADDGKSVAIEKDNLRYVLISSARFEEGLVAKAEDYGIITIDDMKFAEILYDKLDDLGDFMYQLGYIKTYARP